MTPEAMTNEDLRAVREDDELAGEDLQVCPRAWQQRRKLLAHIAYLEDELAARDHQLTALSTPNCWQGPDGSLALEADVFHSQPIHMRKL